MIGRIVAAVLLSLVMILAFWGLSPPHPDATPGSREPEPRDLVAPPPALIESVGIVGSAFTAQDESPEGGPMGDVDLIPDSRRRIAVLVVDGAGSPIADAEVRVEGDFSQLRKRTDVTGRTGFSLLQHEEFMISARRPGYAEKWVVSDDVNNELIRVELQPAATLEVRIADTAGRVVEGLAVSVDSESPIGFSEPTKLKDQGLGIYFADHLATGKQRVVVRENGGLVAVQDVHLVSGRDDRVYLEVPAVFEVEGLVTVGGIPVSSGSVEFEGRRRGVEGDAVAIGETTLPVDSSGRFLYRVRFPADLVCRFLGAEDSGLAGELRQFIDRKTRILHLEIPVISQSIRFTDEAGVPFGGAHVDLSGARNYDGVTDASGWLEIEQLVPGNYTWMLDDAPDDLFPMGAVTLEGGQEIEIVVPPKGRLIVRATGDDVPENWALGFWLGEERWHDLGWHREAEVTVDIPVGSRVIWGRGVSGSAARVTVDVTVDPQECELEFEPSAIIRIRVKWKHPNPDLAKVLIVREENEKGFEDATRAPINHEGLARIGVFPGTYRFRIELPDGAHVDRELTVEGGETKEIVLPGSDDH